MIWSLVKDPSTRRDELVPGPLGDARRAACEARAPRRVVGRPRRTPRGLPARRHRARTATSRRLAERSLGDYHVLAPDLIGHGDSPYEPPWSIDAHARRDRRVGRRAKPAVWIGHSFGARLALELAASQPELVERLVLLDPAILLPAHVALFAAENAPRGARVRVVRGGDRPALRRELAARSAPRARSSSSWPSISSPLGGRRWRYRYSQAAVVAAYGEMASVPRAVRTRPDPDPARAWAATRTSPTTTSSTHTEPRSATCSRSSPSAVDTPCCGTPSTRRRGSHDVPGPPGPNRFGDSRE